MWFTILFCSLTSRTPLECTSETGGGERESDDKEQSARKVTTLARGVILC